MVTDILALFHPLWGQGSFVIKMVALALHTYYYCHFYKRKDSKPAKIMLLKHILTPISSGILLCWMIAYGPPMTVSAFSIV